MRAEWPPGASRPRPKPVWTAGVAESTTDQAWKPSDPDSGPAAAAHAGVGCPPDEMMRGHAVGAFAFAAASTR